jgi:hypothetical protein
VTATKGPPAAGSTERSDYVAVAVMAFALFAPSAVFAAMGGWWWQHRHLHQQRALVTHIVTGALVTAVLLVMFGAEYINAWISLVTAILNAEPEQSVVGSAIILIVVGAPIGWATGVCSRWWWDTRQAKHPINGRGHRERLEEHRQRLIAQAHEQRDIPLVVGDTAVIGGYLTGEPGPGWIIGNDVVLPSDVTHLVAIGASGAGKTESLLRLAVGHLHLGWQVIVIDAKQDPDTGERLARYARNIGINPRRIRTWPAAGPMDLCRGNGIQLRDRLLACAGYSEPYYQAVASTILRLACTDPAKQPATLRELVARLEPTALKTRWAGTSDATTAANLSSTDVQGVRYRYSNLTASLEHIGAVSDQPGGWSWDDCDVTWITLPTATQTATAAAFGRALLVDLITFIRDTERRPTMTRPILLIVEELGAIVSGDPDTAQLVVEAFERARSANVRAVVSVQTVHGLGDPATQARILHSGAGVLAHRMPHPEDISALLGTRYGFEASLGVNADGDLLDRGSLREQHQFVLAPSVIRKLPTGEAVLVHRHHWAHIKVPRVATLKTDTPKSVR